MKPEAHHLPTDLFGRIDELVCGVGHASAAVVERARAYQKALASPGPLCRVIASSLLKKPGARIGLFTGFVEPGSYPKGENDGPLGAAALARGLKLAGFRPTIHVDPEILETTQWLLAGLGAEIAVREIDETVDSRVHSIDAAIAIEKPGANRAGILHTFDGKPIEDGSRSIDRLFLEMNRLGRPTVGIGDLGNEIGFGTLFDTVRELNPGTRSCACGCGGGIAAATPTEHLYPAGVSNWGAYGLTAALALITRDPSIALRPEEERRMLHVAAIRGCCDGVRRRGAFGIDGVRGDVSVRLVSALHELVARGVGNGQKKAPVHDPIERGNEALRE